MPRNPLNYNKTQQTVVYTIAPLDTKHHYIGDKETIPCENSTSNQIELQPISFQQKVPLLSQKSQGVFIQLQSDHTIKVKSHKQIHKVFKYQKGKKALKPYICLIIETNEPKMIRDLFHKQMKLGMQEIGQTKVFMLQDISCLQDVVEKVIQECHDERIEFCVLKKLAQQSSLQCKIQQLWDQLVKRNSQREIQINEQSNNCL